MVSDYPRMLVNIPLLLIAVALLWFPRTWMRRGGSLWRSKKHGNSRSTGSLDGSSVSARREFAKPRNYYDLFRAAAGTLALVGGFGVDAALRNDPHAAHSHATQILGLQAAILLVAVLLQTVRFERRLSLSAPLFFVSGVLIMTCLPWAAVCGFVIAWLLTPIAPNVGGFLMIQAIVILPLQYALAGVVPIALFAVALSLLPVLLSLLTRRPLTVFTRRTTSAPLK